MAHQAIPSTAMTTVFPTWDAPESVWQRNHMFTDPSQVPDSVRRAELEWQQLHSTAPTDPKPRPPTWQEKLFGNEGWTPDRVHGWYTSRGRSDPYALQPISDVNINKHSHEGKFSGTLHDPPDVRDPSEVGRKPLTPIIPFTGPKDMTGSDAPGYPNQGKLHNNNLLATTMAPTSQLPKNEKTKRKKMQQKTNPKKARVRVPKPKVAKVQKRVTQVGSIVNDIVSCIQQPGKATPVRYSDMFTCS